MQRIFLGAVVVVIAITAGVTGAKNISSNYIFTDVAPKQPINFSHKIHAGDNKIECQFCHIYARRSKVSGVPSVQRCMGCHKVARVDSPEIKKLTSYWVNKKPIPWIKVYDVADYIYFPHNRHIKAGLKCQECHGPVETMARVRKENELVMGWCLECHRNREFTGPDGIKRSGPKWDCWDCHT